jgi:hypothetical protein
VAHGDALHPRQIGVGHARHVRVNVNAAEQGAIDTLLIAVDRARITFCNINSVLV